MTILTGNAQGILSVQQVSALIVKPLQATNLALNPAVSTTFPMSSGKLRIPTVETDPTTGWVAESGEIPFSDATFGEQYVPLGKLAGLVAISREAAEDTNPAAALMGQGLVRDLSHKIDMAFFGNVAGGVAPAGLGSRTASRSSRAAMPR